MSLPGRTTYHRDRAPNNPLQSYRAHPPSRLLVNTDDRGSNRATTSPNKTAWFRGPFLASSSRPSTPQLLSSKYLQPRAASHAPARLRLSRCPPHCGWTPPPQRHNNLELTSLVAAAASLCGPRHAASRSRPPAFALCLRPPPVLTLRHPVGLAIGLRVPSKTARSPRLGLSTSLVTQTHRLSYHGFPRPR